MDAITLTAFEVWTRNIRKAPRNHVFNSELLGSGPCAIER